MEKWLENMILRELDATPTELKNLLKRFGCEKETLLPSLAHLEKIGRIKRVGGGYVVNEEI
jgi:predicted Rossmann fold nucleotide-binding protein DprA/Smf involved in DNA uptake